MWLTGYVTTCGHMCPYASPHVAADRHMWPIMATCWHIWPHEAHICPISHYMATCAPYICPTYGNMCPHVPHAANYGYMRAHMATCGPHMPHSASCGHMCSIYRHMWPTYGTHMATYVATCGQLWLHAGTYGHMWPTYALNRIMWPHVPYISPHVPHMLPHAAKYRATCGRI